MSNFLLSFIITTLSGFATLLGSLIIFVKTKHHSKIIGISLVFSASIMLFVSFFDLIPSSFKLINKFYELLPTLMLLFIYLIFGGVLVNIISSKTPKNNNLYKIGIISMLALMLHNIPEGIITFTSSTKDFNLGVSIAISIALHNIPEGIAIAVPIYYAKNSKKQAFIYTLIAAISEPFGAFIAYLFISQINDYLFALILSLTAGIMIYLSVCELLKEYFNNYKDCKVFKYFFLGFLIMILSKIIF